MSGRRVTVGSWLPLLVSLVCAFIFLCGAFLTLARALDPGSHSNEGEMGRKHYSFGNTTRVFGSPFQVAAALRLGAFLDETPMPVPPLQSWYERARSLLEVGTAPRHVILLPREGDDALAWSLPALFWAAHAGSPVFFVARDRLSPDEVQSLRQTGLPLFLVAPAELISENVRAQLEVVASVERVAGSTLASHAVRVAEFRAERADFGWGRAAGNRDGYFEFVIAPPLEAEEALEALPLARSNAAAFLFAADDGGIPAPTDNYLWQQRPDWFVSPSEGPFRHAWIIGDRLSYEAQARIDEALEKGPYASRGSAALGPLEALALVFMAWGLASALFVLLHGMRLLRLVPLGVRLAWALSSLFLPVLGVVLYLAAYRRPMKRETTGIPLFARPPSVQCAAVTVLGFGVCVSLLVGLTYLEAWFGPVFDVALQGRGPLFFPGAGMVVTGLLACLASVLAAWLLTELPLVALIFPSGETSALRVALSLLPGLVLISSVTMTSAWWLQNVKLPVAPRPDETLWFGSFWISGFLAFLVAWPLAYPLVRKNFRLGGV